MVAINTDSSTYLFVLFIDGSLQLEPLFRDKAS